MVFFFTLFSDPTVQCFMGRDKYENEELIKWGWPEDIWFHVDAHSSAHVYIRMPRGKTFADLTPGMVEECCQLTKQNSIAGCKLNDVKIVYTAWSNLKKTADMDVGQVSFHDERQRKYFTVDRKDNVILNRLEKTRVERENVDFRTEREQRDAEVRRAERIEQAEQREADRKVEEERRQMHDQKHYTSLMHEVGMTQSNVNPPDEDDFM
jgi:hypothetical protein